MHKYILVLLEFEKTEWIFFVSHAVAKKRSDAKGKLKRNIIIIPEDNKVEIFSFLYQLNRIDHCRAILSLVKTDAIFGWILFEFGFLT